MQLPSTRALCAQLMQDQALTATDLARAERLIAAQGLGEHQIASTLLKLGAVKEREMMTALAALMGVAVLDEETAEMLVPKGDVARLGSERFARHHRLAVIDESDTHLHVVAGVPLSPAGLEALGYRTGKPLALRLAAQACVTALIEKRYVEAHSDERDTALELPDVPHALEDDIEQLKDMASEAPVIRLVNRLLQEALERRASDIHVEPFEQVLKVRYRVDGVLIEGEAPPVGYTAAVISRLKILARLDIAERRLPQDGRIMLRLQGRELDLRVSTVPTSFGESVVMRLLDRETVSLDFDALGIEGNLRYDIERLLARPHGIFLVTGPTGSGKTTTLYTALSGLNTEARKIITVEDPVEYQLAGINQIQVKPSIGLGFAEALRSIVRQDPDVIMIGEMRDLETCRIAIQSSLTGHLVLSTLHTNSAAATVTRLLDMGAERYLLASTLEGVLAQRLVRRLDPEARVAFEAPPSLIERHGLDRLTDERPIRLYRPANEAVGEGYRGRQAITELLLMDDELRALLMQQADAATLEAAARQKGLVTLHEQGLRLALAGVTSLDEVLRVTGGA